MDNRKASDEMYAIYTIFILCALLGIYGLGDWYIKSRKERKAEKHNNIDVSQHADMASTYIFQDRPDTMLVVNKDKELKIYRARVFAEQERLELAGVDGATLSHIVDTASDNMTAVRQAQRGDKLLVNTSQTADSAYHFRIVRNITADKRIQDFMKQK